MAYTDDGVLAKLSALNETQESIVTVAQWIMFHRRHAERTVQLWFQKLKDSGANKRLNLIYLANEVAQQSKVRRKNDFPVALAPIITEATAIAYRGATNEVQQKLRRVIEVWRQRQIFERPIQDAIEARIEELNKARSSGKKPLLGGSLVPGAAAIPPELAPLVPLQSAVSRLASGKASALTDAQQEYDKLTDVTTATPAPPVYAARLSGMLKLLASAEGAVAESIKARRALLEGLERMLEKNRGLLQGEEAEVAKLAARRAAMEAKKREVEDGIMRGLAEEQQNTASVAGVNGTATAHSGGGSGGGVSEQGTNGGGTGGGGASSGSGGRIMQQRHVAGSVLEPESPAVEALTPPPMEQFTPRHSPTPEPGAAAAPTTTTTTSGAGSHGYGGSGGPFVEDDDFDYAPPSEITPALPALATTGTPTAAPSLSGLNNPFTLNGSAALGSTGRGSNSAHDDGGAAKKRKLNSYGGGDDDAGDDHDVDGTDAAHSSSNSGFGAAPTSNQIAAAALAAAAAATAAAAAAAAGGGGVGVGVGGLAGGIGAPGVGVVGDEQLLGFGAGGEDAMDGLDADVAEILRRDSSHYQ